MLSILNQGIIFTLLLTQFVFAENAWANTPVQIRSFQSENIESMYSTPEDYPEYGLNNDIKISWDIIGASNIKLLSSKGAKYENLSSKGDIWVSTADITKFTLIALGSGSQASQELTIIKPVTAPDKVKPEPSIYLQPLYELDLEPIERSLLVGKNNHNYIADFQKKLHRVSDEGKIIWSIDLQGLIANKPLYLTNDNGESFIFFALSKSSLIDTNVAGQFCRLKIDTKALSCIDLDNNAIAGPAVYIEDGIFSSIQSSTPRLFQIDVTGILHEFSPFESENIQLIGSQQLLLNQKSIRVLTSPQINSLTRQIIVRTQTNDFVAYPLPTEESFVSKSINVITNAFSTESTQYNEQPAQTKAVWSQTLN